MRYVILVLMAASFYGCTNSLTKLSQSGTASINGLVTTAYQMKLEDGRDVWNIECPGSLNSMGNCWERANAICKNGFTLINQETSVGGTSAVVTTSGGALTQGEERRALVQCN